MREIKVTKHFPNYTDVRAYLGDQIDDPSLRRIIYTDRYWMKNDPERYEVVTEWQE